MKRTYLLLVCCSMVLGGFAKHLVGGDIEYICLGKDPQGLNIYEITLSVYRDCQPTADFPTNTPFDTEAFLYIYNAQNNSLETSLIVPLTDTLVLPLTGSDTCVAPPFNLCYALGKYSITAHLPDNSAGYELVWGRCCRNETIQNILQPGEFGMAINARIPNTALCNNSPYFKNLLPTYICRNDLLSFDHSAVDADGDQLSYQIVTPYTAGSRMDAIPVVPPPPFLPIAWLPGYGLNNVMDGSPALRVDPASGELRVRPQNLGQYVFSLEVTERRNGQIIGIVRRDIQVNVIDCPINFPPNIQIPDNDLVNGDTLFFERASETCFSFIISDQNGVGIGRDSLSFSFAGPHLALPDPGDVQVLSQGKDSLLVNVCWTPPCDFVDFDQNSLIFQVRDQNDCPGPNTVRDTLYFQTIPPDLGIPELTCVQVLDANSLQIDWQPLESDDRNGFSHYVLYRDEGMGFLEIAQIQDPDASSYMDTGVLFADSVNYCYQLAVAQQCPDMKIGDPSAAICSEATSSSGICAASYSDAGLELSWTESSSAGFQAYRVYRISNMSRVLIKEIVDPTQTSWVDPAASDAGSIYCYELGIVKGCDTELITEQHCSMPLSITENDFEISLSWDEYIGWDGGVVRYEVWRKTLDGELMLGSIPAVAPLEWIDRDVSADQGGNYCYRIQAIPLSPDMCQVEAWSGEKCISYEASLFFASAFTPNGDGINDYFEIKGSFFNSYTLRILNRWGKEVFLSNSVDNSWDGMTNGRLAPEGVYVFLIEFEDFDGNMLRRSGSVTLIR